jgi:hypothetical protein
MSNRRQRRIAAREARTGRSSVAIMPPSQFQRNRLIRRVDITGCIQGGNDFNIVDTSRLLGVLRQPKETP